MEEQGNRRNSRYQRGNKSRFSNNFSQSFNDSTRTSLSLDELEDKRAPKYPLNKPFTEKVEDKIAHLSQKPTKELPPFDLSEKKFSSRNRLYIANIGNEITEADLTTLFKPYGEIAEVFINAAKNFAFLKVDYKVNAEKAVKELDGVTLKSRNLKMKISPGCYSVKVKNLTPFVTSDLLHYAFSVFGDIEYATVLVDEKGKTTGEGIIDFLRKTSATIAIQKCQEKCYFLTYSLKPVIVEPYDVIDHSVGLLDKHLSKRNHEFNQERSVGPHLAEPNSFEHEYGSRWKSLYELYRQKEEGLRFEFRLECEKLEAQMEFARYEYETEQLRQQLQARELDRERQKNEWEARERRAEEEKLRAVAVIRQTEETLQMKLTRKHDEMSIRQKEADLFMGVKKLSSLLDSQEDLGYEVPSSPTKDRDRFNNKNSLLEAHPSLDLFERPWTGSDKGHWVREDAWDRGYQPKKRRF